MTLGAYITPEAAALLQHAGLDRRTALFVLRSAPLGAADPFVVVAAFRGFPAASLIGPLQAARQRITPEGAVVGMHVAVEAAARRVHPELVDDPRVADVADQLITIIDGLDTTGRPLAAGGQTITASGSRTAPHHPWARLWRALNTLREYRGDAHVATLTAAALPRVQADVLAAAWAGDHMDVDGLRATRRIDDAAWAEASSGLVDRGLLTSRGDLTDRGRELRDRIETTTDLASAAPWHELGEAGTRATWELCAEISTELIAAGEMRSTTPVGSPWPPLPLNASSMRP